MNATIIAIIAFAVPTLVALWRERSWRITADALEADRERGWTKLQALRNAAHLRNEKGQIVRYANASREVRAKAEQN